MEKILEVLLIGIGVMASVAILAVVGGTLVFWIWPVAVPAAFPGLVATSVIASKLSWWESVCLTWLFGVLIKSTQNNTNNNK